MSNDLSFWEPSEDVIIDGFLNTGCDIYKYDDVRSFMLTDKKGKSISNRVISFCISLRLVFHERSKWVRGFIPRINKYSENLSLYVKDNSDPLKKAPFDTAEAVLEEVNKCEEWYKRLAQQAGVQELTFNDAKFRVLRILAVMLLNDPHIPYCRGLERITFVFIILLAKFCFEGNVPLDFGEAVTYHLQVAMLSILPGHIFMKKDDLTKYYIEMDKTLYNYNPTIYEKIKNIGLIHIGVKWESCLYSMQHNIEDIFRIWEQIWGRWEELECIIKAMTLAHLTYFKIPDNPDKLLSMVDTYEEWDTTLIIEEALKLLRHQRSLGQACCEYFCPHLRKYHGYKVGADSF